MPDHSRRAPVFLDRDGTLIVEKHYLRDPEAVCLETGVAAGLALLAGLGHPLVVVSNQSGIGRGLFDAADAQRVNERLAQLLQEQGVRIDAWYLCPHAPETACDCRKPAPGMALAAARDLGLVLEGSYVIGDKRTDLQLADAIRGTGILVTTGHGAEAAAWAQAQARPVFANVQAAAQYIAADVRPSRGVS
jgi:histidinol-phosphate phosphatase family protein